MYIRKGYTEENSKTDDKVVPQQIEKSEEKILSEKKLSLFTEPLEKPKEQNIEEPSQDKKKEKKQKEPKGKRPKGKKVLWILLLVLLAVIIAGVGGFYGLRAMGKKNLQENATSSIPDLISDNISIDESEQGIVYYNGKKYKYNDSIISILCMGIDSDKTVDQAEFGNAGQADSIFLAVLDEQNKKMSLIAISRDTYMDLVLPVGNGDMSYERKGQLTLQYAYWDGKEKSGRHMMNAVSRLMYNLPIHSYAAINLKAVGLINDSVGGVTVTVPKDDPDYLKASGHKAGQKITLKGSEAELFVRNRSIHRSESNNIRISRQREYLVQFVGAFKSKMKSDVTLPVKIFNNASAYLNTDISLDKVTYLGTQVLDYSFSTDNMHTVQGDITQPGRFEEFTVDDKKLYDLIINVFYNEVPNSGFVEVTTSENVETVSTSVDVGTTNAQ